jgi:5-methylcytosine-specific restriction endonuclease McrA
MSRPKESFLVAGGVPERYFDVKPLEVKSKNRPKIHKRARQEIYKRDGYACLMCGNSNPEMLSIDHIVPLSKGGKNRKENMQTLCKLCNSEKGAKTIHCARR